MLAIKPKKNKRIKQNQYNHRWAQYKNKYNQSTCVSWTNVEDGLHLWSVLMSKDNTWLHKKISDFSLKGTNEIKSVMFSVDCQY